MSLLGFKKKFSFRGDRSMLCEPTPDCPRGLAYRRGAPFRERLSASTHAGTPLLVYGTVTSAQTCSPLPGVLLDVWQADANGAYSNLLGLGSSRDEATFSLRGKFQTDGAGAYQFETILPGYYPLGVLRPPRHIHFKLEHPGYQTLFTRLYFEGDPVLKRSFSAKAPLIRPLLPRLGSGEGSEVNFDIVMQTNSFLTLPLKNAVQFQMRNGFAEAQDPSS